MGQQQLLLVILVTIVVGIATVVAINVFGSAADNANESAVTNDLATIAASAQGYYMKPEMLGGGSNSYEDIDWQNIGAIPCDVDANATDPICVNENGGYELGTASETQVIITGTASQATVEGTDGATALVLTATVTPNSIEITQGTGTP